MSQPSRPVAAPLALVTDGARRDTWLLPRFTPRAETPTLDPGESVLMVIRDGWVTLESREPEQNRWQLVWSSPKTATVTLTDRRVVVGCREHGRPIPGRHTGDRRSREGAAALGQCLGIQLRHEWISHVVHVREIDTWRSPSPGCPGIPWHRVGVIAWDRGRRWRLLFGVLRGSGVDGEVAIVLAQTVARSRLRYPDLLDAGELAVAQRCARDARLDTRSGTTRQVHIPAARTIGYRPGRDPQRLSGGRAAADTGTRSRPNPQANAC